ncbi:MAG TPA: tetratricopeptide repeat protein [Phenylobacterium sp.]|nr:tetratricopeptide repeat protein [Phenylobacterium sp.]
MSSRIAEADAALLAGRFDEGVGLIEAYLRDEPKAPVRVYKNFTALLYRHNLFDKAAAWGRQGVEHHPKEAELWNTLGVCLRRTGDLDGALEALNAALKLQPRNEGFLHNKGNVLNDQRKGAEAAAIFSKLVRQTPANSELQRSLGRAYWYAEDYPKAEMRLRLARRLKADNVDAWLDL